MSNTYLDTWHLNGAMKYMSESHKATPSERQEEYIRTRSIKASSAVLEHLLQKDVEKISSLQMSDLDKVIYGVDL